MYAICPECQHSQQISRKRLKKNRGLLSCPKCQHQFNAHTTLSKKPHEAKVLKTAPVAEAQRAERQVPEMQIPEIAALIKTQQQTIEEAETINEAVIELYDWQKTKLAYRPDRWLLGVILGGFLLVYQVYYFNGYSLSQNSQVRPWLSILSSYTNIPLADYHKPLEFTTIGSSLEHTDKGYYRLQVSLINHADFPQPPPYLQLTLQNFYGGIFAQRVFSPKEYLGKTKTILPIKHSATLDIDFLIAAPAQGIGGYTLEFK